MKVTSFGGGGGSNLGCVYHNSSKSNSEDVCNILFKAGSQYIY